MENKTDTDLGLVSNLYVNKDADRPDIYLLEAITEDGERIRLPVTDRAAGILWAELTKILYPRAADPLTQRAATVVSKVAKDPTVASMVAVEPHEDKGLLELCGAGRVVNWTMWFTPQEGENLWAALESIFGHVTQH